MKNVKEKKQSRFTAALDAYQTVEPKKNEVKILNKNRQARRKSAKKITRNPALKQAVNEAKSLIPALVGKKIDNIKDKFRADTAGTLSFIWLILFGSQPAWAKKILEKYKEKYGVDDLEDLVKILFLINISFLKYNDNKIPQSHILTDIQANAPPTGPPKTFNQILDFFSAFLPAIFDEISENPEINRPEIRKYLIQKLAKKAYFHPSLYPIQNLQSLTPQGFEHFENKIKKEIKNHLLKNIYRAVGKSSPEPILASACRAVRRTEISLDAPLNPAGFDFGTATLHGLIASPELEPLEILLKGEKKILLETAILPLSEVEKIEKIKDWEAKTADTQGLLFLVPPAPPSPTPPENPDRYRRQSGVTPVELAFEFEN